MIKDQDLDFWIENRLNLLLVGRHGVGKTSIVKGAFERAGLNYKYYSASTMDPWVDLVGIPKEVGKGEDGSKGYLDLIRPKEFEDDLVEAIFLDEYNRAPMKVRNAVMELIQFKSINGRRFNNLKVVWAAINPDDDDDLDYDVEPLDPAQKDRFEVTATIPYSPDRKYFTAKYGKKTSDAAVSWWKGLPAKIKEVVSPRRLDYALSVLALNGDIKYVLPKSSNVSKLIQDIAKGPIEQRVKDLYEKNDPEEIRKFFSSANDSTAAEELVLGKTNYRKLFLPYFMPEQLSKVVSDNQSVADHVVAERNSTPVFQEAIDNLIRSGTNRRIIRRIEKKIKQSEAGNAGGVNVSGAGSNPVMPEFGTKGSGGNPNYDISSLPTASSVDRVSTYNVLLRNLPQNLTQKQAVDGITILGTIFGRCQEGTIIRKLPKLTALMNHCLVALKHYGVVNSYDELRKSFRRPTSGMIHKLVSSPLLARQVYCYDPKVNHWYDKNGKEKGPMLV
jgi:hypothetical protein